MIQEAKVRLANAKKASVEAAVAAAEVNSTESFSQWEDVFTLLPTSFGKT